ncbi:MAG: hypothetical protein KAG56_03520, partial [Sulfurovaceae bacterium]|nr:hypothetical protein [Sulfurovaceae bacterium]
MNIHKIYSLPLAMLLFSACSQKQVETKTTHNIIKTKKIMAIQPQVQKQVKIATLPSAQINSNIINTPIIVKHPQHRQAPTAIQRHTMVYQEAVPQQIIPFNNPEVVEELIDLEPEPKIQVLQQDFMEMDTDIEAQQYAQEPIQSSDYSDLQGEFRDNYTLTGFIDKMVNEHGFDKNYLNQVFSQAQNTNNFVRPYRAPSSNY